MNTKELDAAYVAPTYKRFPLEIAKGKGSLAWDEQGKEYIDLGTGIAANIFGLADDGWIQAVTEQLTKVQHTSNLYYHEPGSRLAQLLCEGTGMKKVFFGNSGAEANECAIKTARRWAFKKYGDESHSNIITLKNSFHGRTITTLAATGQDVFHKEFGPFTPGFLYADPANPAELSALAEKGCCAIMMEMVQGEGGVNALSPEFVAEAVRVAKEKDLLLIVDEIQTGNGRSGKLCAWMHFGFVPDIMTTAKGLGGGLPIGACLLGERVETVLDAGSHGSTFGANPVCCAGAVYVMEQLNPELLDGVTARAEYIRKELEGAKGVEGISGMGLMIGISSTRPASEVVAACIERGVLVLTAKTKIRLLPALNIPMELLAKAIAILKEELGK
ncbi:MAG: aminotransferase class III-fold pyridoxal phosphate-dependent enzyme [Oscillospiraceae bacterium]|nr:aminotransferase class III-fold pyridoxal phosphate-dependent enzyme [Oscillospiraceae bacterium]